MAKAELEYRWIGAEDFAQHNPVNATIENIAFTEGKTGKPEKLLRFRLPNGDVRQMSVYGAVWNALVLGLGDETDTWKGRMVRISHLTDAATGKTRKTVAV